MATSPAGFTAGGEQQRIHPRNLKLRSKRHRMPNPTSPSRQEHGTCFPSGSTKHLCRVQNHWKKSAATKNRCRSFLENVRLLQKLRRKRLNSLKRWKPIRGGWKRSTTLSLKRSPQLISRWEQRGLQRDQQTTCSQRAMRLRKTSSFFSPRWLRRLS